MTPLEAIRGWLERATPGPWGMNPLFAAVDAFCTGAPLAVCQLLWPTEERSEDETQANAQLIAHAPTDLRYCLERIDALFDAITHGDDEHRAWLKAAIAAHFDGAAVPPTSGSGRKDARIDALESALKEVMGWIKNWSPNFADDDEWPDTEARVTAALIDSAPKGEA